MTNRNTRRLGALTVLGLVAATSACATVSPDEMDASLTSLRDEMRQEMQAGDQRLGERVTGVERRTAALETDLQQMEQEFAVAIQRLEDELRFDVPIYFAFDDATIGDDDTPVLDRFGSVAQKYYPDAIVTVEGFTDSSGSEQYNLSLGMRRATAVREYLIANSPMGQDRVRAVSYGENTERLVKPSSTGPGQEGWENRRVVLVIDHQGEPPMPAVSDD